MGAMFKVAATTYLMLMGLGINAYHISYSQPDHQRNTSEQKSLVDESSLVPFVIAGSKDPDKPEGDTKANWKAIKGDILKSLPEFCSCVPYQIKSIAVKDACKAVSNAKAKYKKTLQVQQVSFRSRKNPYQSCYIPKSAVKPRGIYHTILGQLDYAEELPENFGGLSVSSCPRAVLSVRPLIRAYHPSARQPRAGGSLRPWS
jgi:hypothetical protein